MPARRWGKKPGGDSSPTVVEGGAAGPTCSNDSTEIPTCEGPRLATVSADSVVATRSPKKNERPHICRWYENKENHEATLSLQDDLPSPNLAPAAIEYRHRLRAIWMKQQGIGKADVSKQLKRPEGWVADCWNMKADNVKRPKEVAKYIGEYETRMLREGVEPFRPPMLRRKYVTDSVGMYEECAAGLPWRQAVLRKRNYETGEVAITKIESNRQDCTFPTLRTGITRLDAILQMIKVDFQIADPGAYLICNWYADGQTNIAPHQHDFCSATLCFGASRVFTLDWQPLLLGDGDLLVFGTQRHSVPKMQCVESGRLSVSIFWYPERHKADASFQITLDPAVAERARANGTLNEVLARAAAKQLKGMKLDTGGRGVGKKDYDDDVESSEEGEEYEDQAEGYLSEERLIEIALQVSMMEQ